MFGGELIQKIGTAVLRHVLNGVGASLVAKGVLTGDQELQIIGGIMAAVAVAWSIANKHGAEKRVAAAAGSAGNVVGLDGKPISPDLKGLL